ncbi:zinc finger ZZ-type and EF-hand domain-containing protein 1 isoform X1 [Tachysurus ichikawai]
MGNAESGGTGSGDEEDIEAESPSFTEGGTASAAAPGVGTGGGGNNTATRGSGRSGSSRGSAHAPVASSGLPSPEALMEQVRLREAAGRTGDTATLTVSESAIARNESALVRWLEERLGRGEEALTLEQFCDMLESRDAQRDECEEIRKILEKQSHVMNLPRCFVFCLHFSFLDISPAHNFLVISPASNFLDISPTPNLLDISPTSNFLDISPTSNFLDISPTSNFLDISPSLTFWTLAPPPPF